jgi:hypothetical protein
VTVILNDEAQADLVLSRNCWSRLDYAPLFSNIYIYIWSKMMREVYVY